MEIDSLMVCSNTTLGAVELNVGTLDDIIQFLIEHDIKDLNFDKLNTILLSFHLYTTVYRFLTTIDAKFWDLCFDSSVWPDEKFVLIRSLMKILDRWLDEPYVESFYCPSDFRDLKRLLFVVSQWLRVFVKNYQPIRRRSSKSKESSKSQSIMKARSSIQAMNQQCQIDLAYKIEEICNKVNLVSDKFHLRAGLFKEANCDKDASEVSIDSQVRILKDNSINRFSPRYIAEQFTLYDANLFLKVSPSECLNYVRRRPAPSVESTIHQFNRIYGLVLTTILEADHSKSASTSDSSSPSLTSLTLSVMTAPLQFGHKKSPNDDGRRSARLRSSNSAISCQEFDSVSTTNVLLRAEMLSKWISIAAELRTLRSFSAFTAVMTGLQGCAINNLHETWRYVEWHYPEKMEIFHDLSQLLNLEDNKKYARELLDHMYSSYEISRHQESRHSILSSIFRRKNGADMLLQEETLLKTVGTIPYLGIFLNDLAMLHESAPDRVSRHKPGELQRPASGTSLISMTRNHRDCNRNLSNNSFFDHSSSHQHHSLEPPAPVLPLSSFDSPRRQPRRKRVINSAGCENGGNCSDILTRRPPAPLVIDRRSRRDEDKSETGSSTTPTSSGVVMPKDKRSRQVREARYPLLPMHPRHDIGNISTDSRRRDRSFGASSIISSDTSLFASEDDYLINFRKHWREYKVLAKLMDLQASATRFKIREDAAFKRWFETSVLISESEANEKSKELEPPPRNWRHDGRRISGSLEVLFGGVGLTDEEFSRSRLSSPSTLPSPRISRLPPCHSAIGVLCDDGRFFEDHCLKKNLSKDTIKRNTRSTKNLSGSFNEINILSERSSLSRPHYQLSSIKKKIGDTLHHPRSASSRPTLLPASHTEESMRF